MFTDNRQIRLMSFTFYGKGPIREDPHLYPGITVTLLCPFRAHLALSASVMPTLACLPPKPLSPPNLTPPAISLPASNETALPGTELIFLPQLLPHAGHGPSDPPPPGPLPQVSCLKDRSPKSASLFGGGVPSRHHQTSVTQPPLSFLPSRPQRVTT